MVTAVGRARLAATYTPTSPLLRPRLLHRVRPAASRTRATRTRPAPRGLRERHARAGLRALDQLGLLQRRQAHRRPEDPRLREALRLLLAAAARDAAEHERRRSGLYKQTAELSGPRRIRRRRSTRAGSPSGSIRMLVTPLQMALVGATIANQGQRAEAVPREEGHRAGRLDRQRRPRRRRSASRSSPKTAAELNQMMQLVVQGGTAAGVGFPSSLKVAGKTGTAEIGLGQRLRRVVRLPSRPPTTRATSSRSSSRSSRTASAPRSRPRSRRPSSKTSCTAEHVSTL